jgi:signal transduction histidine kinase/ActR/RegA family two-component response regulator
MCDGVNQSEQQALPELSNQGEIEFRRLLDRLPAGAYTCDPAGLITYFNPCALALWGRAPKLNDPKDRFCGSFRLFAGDGTPIRHDQCGMALALDTGSVFICEELIIQRPDGAYRTVLACANPIRDRARRLSGAVNVLVDITERKHAEATLREADHAKDVFLATLAHELRNPLAPLQSAVQVLRLNSWPTTEVQWSVEVIDRQVQQMTRLIDDLMDVARITRNRLELRVERVELAEVLERAIETSRPLIDAAGHELVVTLPRLPLTLEADPTRLAQAVANLLNNAAKYTERKGHIWLRAERQGSDAVVTVRDTGMGIEAEMLPRIFEMFAQGDRRLRHSPAGLGIGLALVKRLIELHGGTIRAQSAGLGQGSQFTVRLPILIEAPKREPASTQSSQTPEVPLRILIADDNKDSAAALGMFLRMGGDKIHVVSDGKAAVAAAAEFQPDVALLDIGMPQMTGYEAAAEIRHQAWSHDVVLIAISGWGQPSDRQRSKDAGFDHHVVKPVDPSALLRLLASLRQAEAVVSA